MTSATLRLDLERVLEQCLHVSDLQSLGHEAGSGDGAFVLSDLARILVKILLYMLGMDRMRAVFVTVPIPTVVRARRQRRGDQDDCCVLFVSLTSLSVFLNAPLAGGITATPADGGSDASSNQIDDDAAACRQRDAALYDQLVGTLGRQQQEVAPAQHQDRSPLQRLLRSVRVKNTLLKLIIVANANLAQVANCVQSLNAHPALRASAPIINFQRLFSRSAAEARRSGLREYLQC